jgi:membrane-associated protease RseP (regulator of RpoE activity)
MKRFVLAVFFVLVSLWMVEQVSAQSGKTLDLAVEEAAAALSAALPSGSRVMLANVDGPAPALTEYINAALASRIRAASALTLVERSPEVLQRITEESAYQRSGLVSEETIAAMGEQTGAQAVVTGSIARAGELYVFSVRAVDLAGAEVKALYTALVRPDTVLDGLVTNNQNTPRPQWIDFPLEYGRSRYENQTGTGPAVGLAVGRADGPSVWYYDLGVSNRTATERRARDRARENLQQNIAANIASDFGAYIDILELSAFGDRDIEDVQQIVSRSVTNSIQVRLPSFELLEWHIERGTENGAPWHRAYVLVRFPRQDIINMIEEINPAPIVQEILRDLAPPNSRTPQQDMGALLLANMLEARSAVIEALKSESRE